MAVRMVAYRGVMRERAIALVVDEQDLTDGEAVASQGGRRRPPRGAKVKPIMLTPELLAAGAAGDASTWTEYVQRDGDETERGQRWAWDTDGRPLTPATV